MKAILFRLLAATAFLASAAAASAEPLVINFAYAGTGVGGRPFLAQTATAVAYNEGYLTDEFKNDPDISINFTPVSSSSLVNEAFASGQIQFGSQGDLGAIIGRASGLETKIIYLQHIRGPIQIAVPTGSTVAKVEDLAGKKIAVQFSGNARLILEKLLKDRGVDASKVNLVNLDAAGAQLALASGDVDAAAGLNELLTLEQKGLAKVIYTSRNDKPVYGRQSQVSVDAKFEAAHPEIVQRVVKALVKAEAWAATETNREALFNVWAKSGHTVESFRIDFEGQALKDRFNPVIDAFIISRYAEQKDDSLRLGLIRNDFSLDGWFEPKYVETAIKDLNLQGFWPARDLDGNPVAN